MYRIYAETHIIPVLGKRKLRELTVEDVEKLLVDKSEILSTRSLQIIYSILNRAIRKAQVQDKMRRNIVLLCEVPEGRIGRPSNSLTFRQAEAVLKAAEQGSPRMRAYIVVSLLTGARTEEMRALRWCDVDLAGQPDADPPVPPHVVLVRSVRAGGDTKTRKSRRGVELAQRAMIALRVLWEVRPCSHELMSDCICLVIVTRTGKPMGARNVQRGTSGWSWTRPGWSAGSGHPANCGRASCPCCPTSACRWRSSRAWSVTVQPPSRRLSTASNCGRSSKAEPTPWTGSSRLRPTQDRSHSVSHSSTANRPPGTYI
jgi:integrase